MQRPRRVGTLVTGRSVSARWQDLSGEMPSNRVPLSTVIPTEGRNLLVASTVALQATADSSTATPFRNDKGLGVVIPTEGRNLLSLPRASRLARPNLPPGPPKSDCVLRSTRSSSRGAISSVPFRVQSRLRRCESFGNTPDDGRGSGV